MENAADFPLLYSKVNMAAAFPATITDCKEGRPKQAPLLHSLRL